MVRILVIAGVLLALFAVAQGAVQTAGGGRAILSGRQRRIAPRRHWISRTGRITDNRRSTAGPHRASCRLYYSAPVAAYSYKLLQNSGINKVILCGPSHHVPLQGVSIYGPGVIWKTPLGNVICDDTLCNRFLAFDKRFTVAEQAQAREHSLEVQLPFLQTVLKDFRIVPMGMGTQNASDVELLARALESLKLDDHTIMIASSDWQHYRPAAQGYKMDSLGMACLTQLDGDRLQQYLDDGIVEMCGGGPAVAVLRAAIARGANKVKILKYGDSGDITGDKSSVVGYVAVAIYKSTTPAKSSDKKTSETKAKTPEIHRFPIRFRKEEAAGNRSPVD